MTQLPTPNRIKLVKMAAEWRPKAKHMTSGEMHSRLEDIVFDYETDKDGNKKPVYLLEHQRAAIVSYAWAHFPERHEMHRA
jgi:hypothetical protein